MSSQDVRNFFQENRRAVALCAAVLVCLDQWTKQIFVYSDRYYCNSHGPWGVVGSNGFFVVSMSVILAGLVYAMYHLKQTHMQIALMMICAGGLSNLIDRIWLGCVRDLEIVSWFPAFNVADITLTFGCLLVFFAFFRRG